MGRLGLNPSKSGPKMVIPAPVLWPDSDFRVILTFAIILTFAGFSSSRDSHFQASLGSYRLPWAPTGLPGLPCSTCVNPGYPALPVSTQATLLCVHQVVPCCTPGGPVLYTRWSRSRSKVVQEQVKGGPEAGKRAGRLVQKRVRERESWSRSGFGVPVLVYTALVYPPRYRLPAVLDPRIRLPGLDSSLRTAEDDRSGRLPAPEPGVLTAVIYLGGE